MSKKNLLVLDATEHAIIIEALNNYLHYGFKTIFLKREYQRSSEILNILKNEENGYRIKINELNLNSITEALRWNGSFIHAKNNYPKKIDDYTDLSYVLEFRHQHINLFKSFDPKCYTLNHQLREFEKFDFKQKRYLLIRFENNEMEYIKEVHQKEKETDEKYEKRLVQAVIDENEKCIKLSETQKRFLNMKYQALLFSELNNFKVKKIFLITLEV